MAAAPPFFGVRCLGTALVGKAAASRRTPKAYTFPMPTGLRRDLGTIESYAAIIGILIGAGIFKVTSDAWRLTGPSVILGYSSARAGGARHIRRLLRFPLHAARARAGRRIRAHLAHVRRLPVAFVGVWLKIISYIGALAYLSRAFADYAVAECPWRWRSLAFLLRDPCRGRALVRPHPGLDVHHPRRLAHRFDRARILRDHRRELRAVLHARPRADSRRACRRSSSPTPDSSRWRRRRGRCATARVRLPRIFLRGISRDAGHLLLMSIVASACQPGACDSTAPWRRGRRPRGRGADRHHRRD